MLKKRETAWQGSSPYSPDARSLRLPGHQPEEQREDRAVPG